MLLKPGLTKNSQRHLDINILQIFFKNYPTRRHALAINYTRATGAVRQDGGLIRRQDKQEPQTVDEFFKKTEDMTGAADIDVNFLPLSAGFSGGAFSLTRR